MNLPSPPSLLIATQNNGKLREFQDMLTAVPVQLRSLKDLSDFVEVEEAGHTFTENAILKARGYAAQTGLLTLADDSGLEVDALGGDPGVLSARYAGAEATDAERVNKLLTELSLIKNSDRRARFVCVIAIFDPGTSNIATFGGTCEGHIAFEPHGSNGFGYDPVFIPDGYTESFGSLSVGIKQQISHRSRALRASSDFLRNLIASHA